jgi:energy-coupling factor transporter ATP-binding protein EcfA2
MKKSIKLSDYIQIIRPEYVFLKLKPNNSIRNNGTHKVARAISGLYRNVFESIKREEEKLVKLFGKEFILPTKISIHPNIKVGYLIYMEKKKVDFYLIVPKTQLSFIKEKISDVWTNITIDQIAVLPCFTDNSTKHQIIYKKEDGLSLAVDRRNNELLNSNLNVVEMLEEGDRVGVFYNFLPSTQHGWKFKHKATIDKYKSGKPVDRNKAGWSYILRWGAATIDGVLASFAEAISGSDGKSKSKDEDDVGLLTKLFEGMNGQKKLSDWSLKKGNSSTLPLQIVTMTDSTDKIRERNISRSLAQSFDTISEDNELIYKPFKKTFNYTDYSIGAERNCIGDEEAQNFLSLAGRDVLERYNFIEKVETNETEVPEDLQQGVMCIGENIYRGKKQRAFLSNDIEFRNLLLLLIGPTRAGKSNLISHLSIDAIENGECVIIFDFIENCELSDSVAKLFPKEKVLEIRCDDFNAMQGLGYNEVGKSNDTFKQYENAKRQTTNVLTLVNSINADESRLSPKMERYLESASLIVFISNGSIKDVFGVLTNFKIRYQYLKKVPMTQFENLEEYIDNLHELDETDKEGLVTGTKTNLIVGIIDRLNTLKRNTYMELMLKKDTSKNIDLSEEMQKNQLIVVRMPQSMFTVDSERDVYTLFWLSKLWLAAQVRAERIKDKTKRTKINLVIDELYQVSNTEKFLTTKLSQMAKFIVKPIVSCHYINQLKHMRDELRSANTSYMLLAGSDKKNYDELKNELFPFTDEDLKDMKRYYSMNYVKNKDGYSRFITALPDKVEKRIKKGTVKTDDIKN